MFDYFEKIIKLIYQERKAIQRVKIQKHPDEEDLACFLEGKLSETDKLQMEKHLVNCDLCADYVGMHFKMGSALVVDIPDKLFEKIRKLVLGKDEGGFFEILLKLKEKAIEIIQTSGDVLVGQELIPAPILRSRQIRDFKEELTILKDFQKVRAEIRLKNNNAKTFNLEVLIKDKESRREVKDLRIILLRGGLELESYASDGAIVIFKDVYPGVYTVEVASPEEKVAIISITVKV